MQHSLLLFYNLEFTLWKFLFIILEFGICPFGNFLFITLEFALLEFAI